MHTDEVLCEAARAHVRRLYGPSARPTRIKVWVEGLPHPLALPVPVPWREQEQRPRARHSIDFRSVNWYGTHYSFTGTQAPCVRLLWQAMEDDVHELGQEALLEAAGSEAARLSDVFKDSPAWNTRIIPGNCRGTYRLAEPPEGPPHAP